MRHNANPVINCRHMYAVRSPSVKVQVCKTVQDDINSSTRARKLSCAAAAHCGKCTWPLWLSEAVLEKLFVAVASIAPLVTEQTHSLQPTVCNLKLLTIFTCYLRPTASDCAVCAHLLLVPFKVDSGLQDGLQPVVPCRVMPVFAAGVCCCCYQR